MKRTRIGFAAACLFITLSAALMMSATLPPGGEPLGLLPAGPMLVLSADRPADIVANAASFLERAGFEPQARDLRDVMDILEAPGPAEGAEGLQALSGLGRILDLNRRVVVALYAPASGEAQPGVVAYLPARDRQRLEAVIAEGLASAGGPAPLFSSTLPGYLAVGIGADPAPGPAGAAAKLSHLAAYPSSSVVFWVDMKAARDTLGPLVGGMTGMLPGFSADDDGYYDDWDEYADDEDWDEYADDEDWDDDGSDDADAYEEDYDWDSYAEEGEAEGEGDDWDYEDWDEGEWDEDWDEYDYGGMPPLLDSGMLSSLAGMFEAWVEGIDAVEIGVTLTRDRAWLRSILHTAEGSSLADMALGASEGDTGLPYLGYCERDALLSSAWSASGNWMLEALESMYDLLLPSEEAGTLVMDSARKIAAASGKHGAFSLDIGIGDALALAIQSGETDEEMQASLIRTGLSIDLAGVMQLRDRQAYRDALGESVELMNSDAYRELMAGSGFSVDAVRRVGSNAGIPFDHLALKIAADDGTEMEATARAFMDKFTSYSYAYAGDKAFFSLGTPAATANLARRNRAQRVLSSDPAFRTLRAGMPLDARGVLYLSTKRLTRLAMQLNPTQEAQPYAYGDLSGILAWFSAARSSLGWGMGIGAEDIKALAALFR